MEITGFVVLLCFFFLIFLHNLSLYLSTLYLCMGVLHVDGDGDAWTLEWTLVQDCGEVKITKEWKLG